MGLRSKIFLATKFGFCRESQFQIVRGDPEFAKQELEKSTELVQTGYIDLFYYHRMDSSVPIEETMECLKGFVK